MHPRSGTGPDEPGVPSSRLQWSSTLRHPLYTSHAPAKDVTLTGQSLNYYTAEFQWEQHLHSSKRRQPPVGAWREGGKSTLLQRYLYFSPFQASIRSFQRICCSRQVVLRKIRFYTAGVGRYSASPVPPLVIPKKITKNIEWSLPW